MKRALINIQNSGLGGPVACILSLAFCVFFLTLAASAQEADVRAVDGNSVKVERARREVAGDDDPDRQGKIVDTDDHIAGDRRYDTPDQDSDEGELQRDDRARRLRQIQQDGQNERRPGWMVPPEVRKIMKEEGISPEDMTDPEIRRRLTERVRRMSGERGADSRPDGGSPAELRRGRQEQRGEPGDEKLKRYMDAINGKNLFLPLGSGGEERETSYALTAVVSGSSSRAIIEEKGGGRSYYVTEGDTFADEVEVVDIDEQIVKLDRSGEELSLRLGEGTEGNRRGGGGRRGRGRGPETSGEQPSDAGGGPKKGDSPQGSKRGVDASKWPAPFQEMMKRRGISPEQLMSDPELQRELKAEFSRNSRRDGGGRAERNVRTWDRQRDGGLRQRNR